ncbi:MAG TPA: shikimate kinase [Thermoanaerobaculia bacterium]|nr:shikimate kinase [Thermoanaerobaculia bacterium]
MHLFLTGFMGSGKTSVGRLLAARLGWRFVDLDAEVERRAGASVRRIFETLGEAEFRRLEAEELQRAAAGDEAVVATGGGTVCFPAHARLMRAGGMIVWLNPSFATLAARLAAGGKEDRPLFRDETQALALYRERLPAYRAADLTIEIGAAETPEEVAARILLRLGVRRAGRAPDGTRCAT